MEKSKKKRLAVSLTKEMEIAVETIAKRKGITQSAVLSIALNEYIEKISGKGNGLLNVFEK